MNVMQNRQYRLEHTDMVLKVEPGDVVLDCGGGFGDTAVLFAHEAGTDGMVYCFEFEQSNLQLIAKNLELNPELKSRISVIENAVHEFSDVVFEYEDKLGGTSLLTGVGDKQVLSVAIDDFVTRSHLEKVDFIKMDVEGAEGAALAGAKSTLRKFKPKLAISAYHKQRDLFEIADQIAEIEPGYEFWLDHHSIHQEETVLYAACT